MKTGQFMCPSTTIDSNSKYADVVSMGTRAEMTGVLVFKNNFAFAFMCRYYCFRGYYKTEMSRNQYSGSFGCVQIWAQFSILSPVEGCGFSGESVQTRILRQAQDASAPKNERTPLVSSENRRLQWLLYAQGGDIGSSMLCKWLCLPNRCHIDLCSCLTLQPVA